MLRWLGRLLVIGLILAAIGFAVSRLMGQDDDFDDFDDLDSDFDFQETPVEIDVPAGDEGSPNGQAASARVGAAGGAQAADTTASTSGANTTKNSGSPDSTADSESSAQAGEAHGAASSAEERAGDKLTDINGVGPAYEARLQAIGINTFSDLANADANSIAEQLGVIGGQQAVEDWIAQARELGGDSGATSGNA